MTTHTSSWQSLKQIFTDSKAIVHAISSHENYKKKFKKNIDALSVAWFILLILALVLQIALSWTHKWFIDGLQHKDMKVFMFGLTSYIIGSLIYAPLQSGLHYLQDILQAKTNQACTSIILDYYYENNAIYYLSTDQNHNIDNPSARIETDVYDWVDGFLTFTVSVVQNVTQFFGWLGLLIYLRLFILVYAFICTAFILFILLTIFGAKLIHLRYQYTKLSAEFRTGLFRSEEFSESIAFYNSNNFEKIFNNNKLKDFINILISMAKWYGLLNLSNIITQQFVGIGPILLLYPLYFNNIITLGKMFQAGEAGKNLILSFGFIVSRLALLAKIGSTATRVNDLIQELIRINKYTINPPIVQSLTTPRSQSNIFLNGGINNGVTIKIDNIKKHEEIFDGIIYKSINNNEKNICLNINELSLFVPNLNRNNHTLLLYKVSFYCKYNQNTLITGPSGCGKSSLMRAIAGMWNIGKGTISIISKNNTMFIGQKPYLPVMPNEFDSLKNQIMFPNLNNKLNDKEFNQIIDELNLSYIKQYESVSHKEGKPIDWSKALSGGEMQRLAFGRILVNKPKLVFLDESTSALDTENQDKMYQLLNKYNITYVSIGHRTKLASFHQQIIHIDKDGEWKIMTQEEFINAFPESNESPEDTAFPQIKRPSVNF